MHNGEGDNRKRDRSVPSKGKSKSAGNLHLNNEQILHMSLFHLPFSSRLQTIFEKENLETVGKLIQMRRSDFLLLKGVGKATLEEVDAFMRDFNLKWENK